MFGFRARQGEPPPLVFGHNFHQKRDSDSCIFPSKSYIYTEFSAKVAVETSELRNPVSINPLLMEARGHWRGMLSEIKGAVKRECTGHGSND